jgi:hypothetical protein
LIEASSAACQALSAGGREIATFFTSTSTEGSTDTSADMTLLPGQSFLLERCSGRKLRKQSWPKELQEPTLRSSSFVPPVYYGLFINNSL